MGIAWCRERVEQAQNSKSPVDRILIRCNKLMKPRSPYSRSHGKVVNDFVYKGMRTRNLGSSYPVPVHAVPPKARHRLHLKVHDWRRANFIVGDSADVSKTPIPPPRKKRKRKINSTEVLNSRFPELYSPGYVIQSENLRNKSLPHTNGTGDRKETDVSDPPGKFYWKEKRTLGNDRFEKLSRKRMRKIRAESYPKDETAEKRIKNDGVKWGREGKIKHVSTVSLPNYNELIKRNRKVSADTGRNGDDKNGNQSVGLKLPRRNSSTISLPGEGSNSILSSLSEATIHCLETYMKRCRSFGSLKPQQILEKLEEFNKTRRSPSESSDSWCGLDEWDLGVIEHCDPKSNVPPKGGVPKKHEKAAVFIIGGDKIRRHSSAGKKPVILNQETKGKLEVESFQHKIPLEWFLNPERRYPALNDAPAAESSGQKWLKTPPPSPAEVEASTKESIKDAKEHSSLLKILRRYKGDESESEVWTDAGEPANVAADDSQKESMNFDEVNVEISSKQNLNPFISMKNRSNSLKEEKLRESSLTEERHTSRSSSNSFGCSTDLLRQLQNNKEAIEREILQRPNELLERLRRESLFRSVPKDAFEAFEKRKMTSLRESLNEFLGFSETPEDAEEKNGDLDADGEGKATGDGHLEVEASMSSDPPETPPLGAPIEITINLVQKEEKSTLFPNALVTFKEDV